MYNVQIFGVTMNFVGYANLHMMNIIIKILFQCVLDFHLLILKHILQKIKERD